MQTWVSNNLVSLIAVAATALIAVFGLTRPTPAPIEVRPREIQPSPTAVIYVHVDGAVQVPGVYALASGGRIFEAIELAGGTTDDANVRELNLAARVADGQKLVIPARAPELAPPGASDPAAPEPVAARAVAAAAPAVAASSDARINLNTATQRILESLPGVGPVTATRIVEFRQANGPFTRVEQLRDARLVNASTYERVRNLVTVD